MPDDRLQELLDKLQECDELLQERGYPVLAAGVRTYREFVVNTEGATVDEEVTSDGD